MQERIDTMNVETQNTGLNQVQAVSPIQAQERIEVLDVIRGLALLGILMVHLPVMFGTPAVYLEILGKNTFAGFWDTAAASFVNFLIQGKFYTIFSFLFGLGFFIFYERAAAKTAKPTRLFFRRLFVLLLIGLAHAFFIWYGDVLVTYALLGFLLPLFFKRKPKTMIWWTAGLFLAFVLFMAVSMVGVALAKTLQEGLLDGKMQELFADMESRAESAYHAYGQGTFAEIMAQRASDSLFIYQQALFASIFLVFPLFLLGLYAGKREIFRNVEANLSFIKKTWAWGLAIGLTMSVVKFICKIQIAGDPLSFYATSFATVGFIGDTGLCLFLMTSIVLLCRNKKWMLKLKPLAYTGRMALSNYLFQSIVCTTIFYSYGLGLYGKIGPALGLALAVVFFTGQVFISKYWLKRYQFGPMEWVWRCLTYGKFFGMKK
jgi:uncharacterized protein